ncbi:MAG: hypothetical protein K2I60_01800 [Oscillospiraceae bacterium]|nr:hypothetical protein [Oscillospiraceae bacterium]
MFIKQVYRCPYCNVKTSNAICCSSCADDLKQFVNNKTGKTPYCDEFSAPLVYDDIVRDAIIRFKFNDCPDYYEGFAQLMSSCNFLDADIIISVPSFKKNKKYNTSALLAKCISKQIGIDYEPRAVKKIRETKYQHQCDFEQRLTNLDDSFVAKPRKASGKNILICDDIITSGSTIDEIAKACKHARANKVYAIAIAISNVAFHYENNINKFKNEQ